MNNERKTFYTFAVFAALFLTGCAAILHSTFHLQQITVVADDDDAYDFYVNGNLKCENTNVCDFYRTTGSLCRLTIEAMRGNVVLGVEKYGYWEEPNFISRMFQKDDSDKYKCPENLFNGAHAVVKIDQDTKKRMNAARERARLKKSETQWETSPLRSNSAE